MPRILKFTATAEDEGRMVRDVIRNHFRLVAHDIARAKYRTENGITVDGETVLVNRLLKEDETLKITLSDEDPGKIVPAPGDLDILYEDEDILAVNKPAGIVVHPSHGHFADTLSNYAAHYFCEKGEPHEIRTAGRLDKDTSGIVIFGKSRTAAAHLAGQVGDFPVRKTYLAVAEGIFRERTGTIDAPISREYEDKIRRVIRADGDPAVTHYEVLEQYEEYAVLALRLETGRTHQIRVHMKYAGHPLYGDPIYNPGHSGPYGIQRSALHAWKADLLQPFQGNRIHLEAPVPEDLGLYIKVTG